MKKHMQLSENIIGNSPLLVERATPHFVIYDTTQDAST